MNRRKIDNIPEDENKDFENDYASEVQKQIDSLNNSPLSDETEISKLVNSDAVKKSVIINLMSQCDDYGENLDLALNKAYEFTLEEYVERLRDHKQLFEHALIVQTDECEISIAMGIPVDMLQRVCFLEYGQSFDKIKKKFQSIGRIMLRYSQMKLADRYPVMATWLGRQYLNQKERVEKGNTSRTDKQIVERVQEILNINLDLD
jgi:hypothetical protein